MVGERRDAASPGTAGQTQTESQSVKTTPYAKSQDPGNASISNGGHLENLGGKFPEEVSFIDGLKTVQLSDLKEGHKKPCVRDSLLTGIGTGFGIGGLRAVLGARVPIICNWAVGSFLLSSVLMHEYCQRWRTVEKQNMKRIVEVVDRKRAEKKLREQNANNESRATK